jgi:hypothetical protein
METKGGSCLTACNLFLSLSAVQYVFQLNLGRSEQTIVIAELLFVIVLLPLQKRRSLHHRRLSLFVLLNKIHIIVDRIFVVFVSHDRITEMTTKPAHEPLLFALVVIVPHHLAEVIKGLQLPSRLRLS